MKTLLALVLFLTPCLWSIAQTGIAGAINQQYLQPVYNPETRSVNPSYNYSNTWDFDLDGRKDSLVFIGNGGAHTWYYPVLLLSSGQSFRFRSIKLDRPYFVSGDVLEKWGKNAGVQLVIDDLDKNGAPAIYLNFNNDWSSIPKAWKRQGVKTKYVVMHFAGGRLKVRDH